MKHNQSSTRMRFVEEPKEFNKYTEREQLQYCLGALLYMPATKDFTRAIKNWRYPELTSIAMCFEDACEDERVEEAEQNVLETLDVLTEAIQDGELQQSEVPLIFFRVRSMEQFQHFSQQLKPEHIKLVTGFIFPKFNSKNGMKYLSYLKTLNEQFGEPLYGMPILEDRRIAQKEARIEELLKIKTILDQYKDLVLNVRVGCTDLSSCFGVRRSFEQTIYDVITVKDCLSDILNVFLRDDGYVISGPVWEYFPKGINGNEDFNIECGLKRETCLDKINGFIGKTCIHPTQVKRVNEIYAVTEGEFRDAQQILQMSSGVAKGSSGMNETKPHKNWATRIMGRAIAYGVVEED